MSYAVIKTGGKQYRVTEGDLVAVDRIEGESGDSATFETVLAVGEGGSVNLGTPTVSGASVTAEVVEQFRGKKVTAFKYKRRKGYHRTIGHRQDLTRVKIKAING